MKLTKPPQIIHTSKILIATMAILFSSQSFAFKKNSCLPGDEINVEMNSNAKPSDDKIETPEKLTSDEFINFGHSIWKVFNNSRPQIKFSQNKVHVLPNSAVCWNDLELWNIPTIHNFPLNLYSKLLHRTLLKAVFSLSFSHGGQMNGGGQYLTGLTVMPKSIEIKRKLLFNANAEITKIINVGTKNNPIAGVELQIKWTLEKIKKKKNKPLQDGLIVFFIQGDGLVQRLK